MKNTISARIALIFLFVFFTKHVFSQSFNWAKGFPSCTSISKPIVDAMGNVYTTGHFNGTVDFDPGPGVYNVSSTTTGYGESFVLKIDAAGNFLWVKIFTSVSTATSAGISLILDNNGDLLVNGEFNGTIDLDPGGGTYYVTAVNWEDAFITKLSGLTGDFIWAKQVGGIGIQEFVDMVVDKDNNILLTGFTQGTVDFDPGAGVYSYTPAVSDAFVLKLDENGNFEWVKTFSGTSDVGTSSICLDTAKNIYITGGFHYTADFDPGPGVYNLVTNGAEADAFVAKLDSSGNFVWAFQIGVPFKQDGGQGIVVGKSGNVYCTGAFEGTVDFDPGSGVYNMTSMSLDIYVCKFDKNGNFIWAKQAGESNSDVGMGIAVDSLENVYVTGSYAGIVDFDPGPGVFNLSSVSPTDNDAFILKLDAAGNYMWAGSMGGSGSDIGWGITVDRDGSIYTAGPYIFTGDYDPGPGVYNLTGGHSVFIQKLSQCSATIPTLTITATPGTTITPGQNDTFTAVCTIAPFTPYYEWFVNGTSVTVSTSPVFVTGTLTNGDTVTCVMTTNERCVPFLYSPNIVVHVVSSGINDLAISDVISVFPNPNMGMFTIKGNYCTVGKPIRCSVMDLLGHETYGADINPAQNGDIVKNIQLSNVPPGVYLLKFSSGDDSKVIRFVIER